MYLLWRVYYSSPNRVTDLFGRACICCGGCTIVVLIGYLIYLEGRVFVLAGVL